MIEFDKTKCKDCVVITVCENICDEQLEILMKYKKPNRNGSVYVFPSEFGKRMLEFKDWKRDANNDVINGPTEGALFSIEVCSSGC